MARLNDTEALVRQGIRAPQLRTAGEQYIWNPSGEQRFSSNEDAAAAVSGPQPGKFRRETGAGISTLAAGVACAKGECDE